MRRSERAGRLVTITISGVLVSLAGGASAQVPATQPDSVAQAYLDAVEDGDWRRAARLLHPQLRLEYKKNLSLMFRCYAGDDTVTVADYRSVHPDADREAAAVRVRQINEWREGGRRIHGPAAQFPELGTIEAFEALPAEEVMARVLERTERRAPSVPDVPDYQQDPRVIGHVVEGDWANVLFRYRYEYEEGDPAATRSFVRHLPHVIMLRRDGETWGVGSLMGIGTGGYYGPGLLDSMRQNAFCPEVLKPFAVDSAGARSPRR